MDFFSKLKALFCNNVFKTMANASAWEVSLLKNSLNTLGISPVFKNYVNGAKSHLEKLDNVAFCNVKLIYKHLLTETTNSQGGNPNKRPEFPRTKRVWANINKIRVNFEHKMCIFDIANNLCVTK